MAGQLERQPGFVNFLTKNDRFGFFLFRRDRHFGKN